MSFQNQTKLILENILNNDDFKYLLNANIRIIDIQDNRHSSGYTHLHFNLTNQLYNIEFEYVFGRNINQNPVIINVQINCNIPKIDFNTYLRITSELNIFQNTTRNDLLDSYSNFF